jgi:hypothetical protein
MECGRGPGNRERREIRTKVLHLFAVKIDKVTIDPK